MNVREHFKRVSKLYALTLILLLSGVCSWAQVRVTGKVIDVNGQPMGFVTVIVKGTTSLATNSADNGTFTLNNVPNNAVLIASSIGYKTQEVALNGRAYIEIVMEENAISIDEVVVTALGISRSKKALGYAVQDVKGDELQKVRTQNVVSALSGRVAGVQVAAASGQMGGGAKINVRGNTSLTGNNQPLFVVDGIPISNADFSYGATGGGGYDMGNLAGDLNPDDIESMSVLKGASATALYGSRAANGVVMVTTKKAKAAQKTFGVSVNSSVTLEEAAYMPELQKLYGGGFQYSGAGTLDGFLTASINGKTYRLVDYSTDESWGPKYDPNIKVLKWNAFDSWDTANYLNETPWVYPKNDYKTYFQTGVNLTNNVQISKATEESTFRMSFTNSEITGITPNSKLSRNTISINGTSKMNKYLDIWATANYINNKATGRPETGYGDRNPIQKMWQWSQTQLDYKDLKDYLNPDGTQRTWNRSSWDDATPLYTDNPYWSAYKNFQNDKRNRIYGNTGMNITLNSWIKFTGRVGLDYFNLTMEERYAVGSQATSEYYLDNREALEITTEAFVNLNKRFFNDKFGVSGLIGAASSDRKSWRTGGITVGGLVNPNVYNLSNSQTKATVYDTKTSKRINSVFANATMDFYQFLFIDLTARNDWSSTLPQANRSYFYPSINVSALLTSLDFMKSYKWVNYAKLRGGWAKVGNDTDPYNLESYYAASTGGAFGSNPRYNAPTTMANPNLKPESTRSWELGLEARFLNNRLGFDLSYYEKHTYDQIVPAMVSGATGYASMYINSGHMSNKGIELTLNGSPVMTKNFTWDVQLNVATLDNKVETIAEGLSYLNLQNGPFRVKSGAFVGASYPVIYGTGYVYDDQGNKLINPSTGYYAASPIKPIGNATPSFTAGLTNTFNYKGFDMSILIDMQRGGNMYYTSYMWGMYSGIFEESALQNGIDIRENGLSLESYYGKWDAVNNKFVYTDASGNVSATPVANTKVLDAETYGAYHYDRNDEKNVFSTDFIKLREIRLGYTIPAKYTGPIKQLRISAYGRNLAIWGRATKHFDPEYLQMAGSNAQGIEGGYVPSTRSYGFSLSFNF